MPTNCHDADPPPPALVVQSHAYSDIISGVAAEIPSTGQSLGSMLLSK